MMRRTLLIVAMLLLAAPAFAAVTITATAEANGVVVVSYNCSGSEKVRAFALEITVDGSATIDHIRDYNTGESNKPPTVPRGGGYGIFPGRFRDVINASSPNWADPCYHPVAPSGDPGASGSGLGTNKIVVELGTLYKDANGPGTSGTLFVLDVNCHGDESDNLSMAVNAIRGGVVKEDGTSITPVLNGTAITCPVIFTCGDCALDVSGWEGEGFKDGFVGPEDLSTLMNLITSPACAANYNYCDVTTLEPWQACLDVSGWEGAGFPDGFVGPEDLSSLMNVITDPACVANYNYCTCPVPPPPY